MFTPEYLSDLVEATSAAATDFNMYLTNKVIDSVIGLFEKEGKLRVIPSNQQRINLLKQSGILVFDIEQEIRKRLPGLDKKVREAFYQAGYEINEDINKSVYEMVESDKELKSFVGKAPRIENLTEDEKKILDAAYKRTNGEIRNLTRTTAADINRQFLKSCDSAWWKAKHGIDVATAIREAIDEVSMYGSHVIYRHNGKERKLSIESAIRMCVLTGINQANAEITLSFCADTGTKNVLVSSHLGARYTDKVEPANHESWQGKIYTLSESLLNKYGYQDSEKKSEKFAKIREFFLRFRKKRTYEDFEIVTGYGTIEGLCGINCRHTFEPFYPGMTNNQRQYDTGENKKNYDLSQKKRAMERQIRNTKKRLFEVRHAIKAASDEGLTDELKSKEAEIKSLFDEQNSAYSAFCGKNGLRRSEDRLYVSKNRASMDDVAGGYRRFVGTNKIFEGKTPIEKCNIAKELTEKYVIRESKWKGTVNVDDERCKADHITGRKEWSCTILVNTRTQPKTYIHEMLHSRSASYLNPATYIPHRKMEEASTEFLARQICEKEGISYIYKVRSDIDALIRINQIIKNEDTNFNFAQTLYNKDIKVRYSWLENKVNRYLLYNGEEYKEELENCLKMLKGNIWKN